MKDLLKAIDEVGKILQPLLSAEAYSAFNRQQNEIKSTVNDHIYIRVPIVGIYSTGKTSLINTLLGEEGKLPVNKDPMTAIPCEIWPVQEGMVSHIEVFREDEIIFNGPIVRFREVVTRPGDFARCYCSAKPIQQWYEKGIVLVDMPGADSGVKQHNDALMQYIKKGTVYTFLQDASDGAISKTGLNFLDEIMRYGLEVHIFASRIDLVKTKQSLNATIDYIKSQIDGKSNLFYAGKLCTKKGQENVDSFSSFIEGIDAREKGRKQMVPLVGSFINSQIQLLRELEAVISSTNAADLEKQIKDLENRISRIKSELEDALNSADTPEKSTNDILERIDKAIKDNASVVAKAFLDAKKGDRISVVSETLTEILRPELVAAFSEEQQQYIDALRADIDALTNRLIANTTITEGIFADIIANQSESIIFGIRFFAEKMMNNGHPYIAMLGQILAFVAEYVPDFLRGLFGKSDEEIKEGLQKQVRTVVCAKICHELYPAILMQVKLMQKQVLEATRKQFEARLDQLYSQLNALRKTYANDQAAVNRVRDEFAQAITQLEQERDTITKEDKPHA